MVSILKIETDIAITESPLDEFKIELLLESLLVEHPSNGCYTAAMALESRKQLPDR
jgi:hypothetical protein